ncbi:NUDIX domain-containing protein [Pedobacter insulae]|uniref:NUDIX domain-containing protein n=1 Tax=Pedobacter insulae TaxID=414048 RepID=A0A1I2UN86_9SPHI|nr:NUDIX domain-containing protein [Pedobacter insulae]
MFIADRIPKQLEKIQHIDTQNFDFQTFYKNLPKEGKKNYVLVDKDPKMLFKMLKKQCTVIKAAGGLVANSKGEILFIFRNKKWDLPKGKVEKDEKVKVTAVREVEEECGVKIEKRRKLVCKTYHIYEMNGKVILKRTNWYNMEVKGSPKLVPQKEEGITSASWVNESGIKNKVKNTYPLIIEVLKEGGLV